MTLNALPHFSANPSKSVLNCLPPKSEIALDNLRFLTIPETFKSSQTITWFSLIISVDNILQYQFHKILLRWFSLLVGI